MAKKFAENVLLEIVDIVRWGLSTQRDVSQQLRNIRVEDSADGVSVELAKTYEVTREEV